MHRPIGIGVQGLADVFALMDIPFYSDKALEINKNIFETIYHAALECSFELSYNRMNQMKKLMEINKKLDIFLDSNDLISREYHNAIISDTDQNMQYEELLSTIKPIPAEMNNLNNDYVGAYSSFDGSPASKGILQFDMWNVEHSDRYDWELLKKSIIQYGIRNSLLLAPMPTASTSQILGNNECFEPFTSNIYTRRTIAGDFVVPNKHLMKDLLELGLWTEDIKNNIILNKGSVQYIDAIPQHIKDKYKIVWEIPMRHLIDMAADRGAYICQSQSMNLWIEDPDYKILTSMHFHSWRRGLKTGIYYLRRKPKHQPQQFTIDPEKKNNDDNEDVCEMCSG